MNLKEEYIKMRLSGVYNDAWFFNYYLSQGGIIKDIQRFSIMFLKYSTNAFAIQQDINFILDYLDNKYNLILVQDVNKKIIKIIQ